MFRSTSVTLVLMAGSACAAETGRAELPVWSPLSPSEAYEGKSLEDWAIEWRRWAYAQTDCEQDTRFDQTGALCGLHQSEDSPVFYFDRGRPGTTRDQCHVPRGKALVVPVAMYSIDNAGVAEPLSEAELLEAATTAKRSARDMFLELDGREVTDLEMREVGPVKLSYYIPPTPNWYSCRMMADVADTTVEPVYLSGVLALLSPPEAGAHTIRYRSTLTLRAGDALRSEVTSHFHVD